MYSPQQPSQPYYGQPMGGQNYAQAQPYSHPPSPVIGSQMAYMQPTAVVGTTIIPTTTALPVVTACPYCHQQVTTMVDRQLSSLGWILIILLYIFFFPLSWVPLCYDYSYRHIHACPNCRAIMSTHV